jgi:glycosyltransferase involved in cell wall biosynthesis
MSLLNAPFATNRPPRVAVLVDLPRSAQAGGHVKWWERLAAAAGAEDGQGDPPLDLTVYFSGDGPDEVLSPHVRMRHLPPVFSTARLKFLPYVPDHTDLSPHHPRLARELPHYDLIHATDGFFAFTRTAERVASRRAIPLTTSFHTDTPPYAGIGVRDAIEKIFASRPWVRRKLIEDWDAPGRQVARMEARLRRHLRQCDFAFATRAGDRRLASDILGAARVGDLRLGVDKAMFGPHRRDAAGVRRDHAIPDGRRVALFVGRVDVGKNVPTLIEAAARAIGAGAPLHLLVAGLGPLAGAAARRLGDHVSLLGFVKPDELARLYASVDLFTLPSEVEIGSMATFEAIASGCPALIAQSSGSHEIFNHSPAILSIESGVDSWSAALRGLVEDGERLAAMRAAALDYGARHLASWRDVLREDLLSGWRATLKVA